MTEVNLIDNLCKKCFGKVAYCLFEIICMDHPGASLKEKKDIFFSSLDLMLKEGRIKLLSAQVDCYISPRNPNPIHLINDKHVHWKKSSEEIINALKNRWPTHVVTDDDIDLVAYFYEIPGLIWVARDGSLHAS
jgi:hypothetical protein